MNQLKATANRAKAAKNTQLHPVSCGTEGSVPAIAALYSACLQPSRRAPPHYAPLLRLALLIALLLLSLPHTSLPCFPPLLAMLLSTSSFLPCFPPRHSPPPTPCTLLLHLLRSSSSAQSTSFSAPSYAPPPTPRTILLRLVHSYLASYTPPLPRTLLLLSTVHLRLLVGSSSASSYASPPLHTCLLGTVHLCLLLCLLLVCASSSAQSSSAASSSSHAPPPPLYRLSVRRLFI